MQDKARRQKLTYSINEACDVIGVRRDLLYRLINQGELPSLKIGDRRVIRRQALEAFLQASELKTSSAMGFGHD